MLFWGGEAEWNALTQFDLWNALPVVRDGKVVHGSVMTNYGSVYAAQEVLRIYDELYTLLA